VSSKKKRKPRALPTRLQLPGGRRVELEVTRSVTPPKESLTAALELLDAGAVVVRAAGKHVAPDELRLVELHALRAIFAACGLVEEDELTVDCKNCEAPIVLRPARAMPLGPFIDAELDDPELDAVLDLDVAHPIPPVAIPGGQATTVRLAPVSVERARALFSALAKRTLKLRASVVQGMGIASLGDVTAPAAIARALQSASDEAFGEVTNLFLRAHYPLRLGAIVACPACGARNDVDAPYEREFPPWHGVSAITEAGTFPELEAFDAAARRIAEELLGEAFGDEIAFVVEGGVPACDDGGEPLLGSYVPGSPGDGAVPSRAPEITVYYRTFRAMWDEDGPYDWEAELDETIAHELEHHVAEGRGDDPVDAEERAEIEREAARIHGKKALARGAAAHLGRDFGEFLRRTWPVWIVALLVAIATIVATR
jgi:hypothetical protein